MERINGTVLFWNEKKGYGFVKSDAGLDYFIHFKNIKEKGFKNLYRGQRVNFFPNKTEKGYTAKKLHYEKAMHYIEEQR